MKNLLILFTLFLFSCAKNIEPRSYQFQIIDQHHALLYDGDKLVGKFKFSVTQLDTLICKDNE